MPTSKRVAKEASKELRDPKATKEEKSVAGAALEAARHKKKQRKG